MALRHLNLRDFVIVPALELALGTGFTVLTGETGAGKSILIDALQLVLGGRGEAIWVREGQARCEISAEFDAPPDVLDWLQTRGFDADSHTLLLRRTIDASGKSRAWINGSPATVAQLRELADRLLDIHGQHAWQSLTRPAAVRSLVDSYAGVDSPALAAAWALRQQAAGTLAQAQAAQASLAQERERLLWQIGELDKLAPGVGEWDDLNQRHTRLSHAQALMEAAQAAASALEGDDGRRGALAELAQATGQLQAHAAVEPEFSALIEVMEASIAQTQDAAHTLHAYLRRAEPDPGQLEALDARMGLWMGLARRYRRAPEDLPALLTGWRQELTRLESAADLDALTREAQQADQHFLREAKEASRLRRAAAPRLAAAVTEAMQELGMKGGRFDVALEPLSEPLAHGLESTTLLVAAHPGSTPRPIDKVASGGELSRLALAIAVTTSRIGTAATLVFDEVDAGVGGAVAATVGSLLQRLGHDRQVLCVTHLPQVAAYAHHHLLVSKGQGATGATSSQVEPITQGAREHEIARMLSGEKISDATLAHARELLQTHGATLAPAGPTRTPRRGEGKT